MRCLGKKNILRSRQTSDFLCFFVGNGWPFIEPFFTMQGLTCLEHTPNKKVRGTASQETQEASETALLGHVSRCASPDFPRWVRKPHIWTFVAMVLIRRRSALMKLEYSDFQFGQFHAQPQFVGDEFQTKKSNSFENLQLSISCLNQFHSITQHSSAQVGQALDAQAPTFWPFP